MPDSPTVVETRFPTMHPSARILADVELLLSGAFAPRTAFGGDVPMDDDLRTLAAAEGGVILVDDEGAAVAEVHADGSLRGLTHPASGSFRSLHLRPADLAPATDRLGVLLHRPLLREEVDALAGAAEDEQVLLLVRTVEPAIPSDVLVRAVVAAARAIPRSQIVALPFARRQDAEADARLARAVLDSYGATRFDGMAPDSVWQRAEAALDEDDSEALDALLDQSTLQVLRRWRPPRPQRGLVVFFTGLSGSGKSTVARGLVDRLHETERSVTVLDGDVARRMLSAGLGFSRQDRDLNIRRLGWVGAEVARHGGVAVLAPIAPFASTRTEVRRMVETHGDLVLVWVSTPLSECERRDRKGLYAAARRGEIAEFTGISSPYEEPADADVILDTTTMSVEDAVSAVWEHLRGGGWISRSDADA
jgi:sulfate adenylyltransferase